MRVSPLAVTPSQKPPLGSQAWGLFSPDRLCILANEAGGDTVRSVTPVPVSGTFSGASWGTSKRWFGPSILHDALADKVSFGDASQILPTQGVTIILGYSKTSPGTFSAVAAFGVDDTSAVTRCGAQIPHSDGKVYWDFGGTTEGTTRLSIASLTFSDDVWAFTTGARGMEIWQNGNLKASNAANPSRTASTNAFKLGVHATVTDSDNADYGFIYVYSQQLSPSAIQHLSVNPFCFISAIRNPWIGRFPQSGTLALDRLHIHIVPVAASSSNAFNPLALINEAGYGRSSTIQAGRYKLRGRTKPMTIYGQIVSNSLSNTTVVIPQATRSDYDTLVTIWETQAQTVQPVCVRDQKGNKLFGHISRPEAKEFQTHFQISFEVQEIEYSEAV